MVKLFVLRSLRGRGNGQGKAQRQKESQKCKKRSPPEPLGAGSVSARSSDRALLTPLVIELSRVNGFKDSPIDNSSPCVIVTLGFRRFC